MKKLVLYIIIASISVAMVNAAPAKRKPAKADIEKVDSIALMIEKANSGEANAQNTVGVWYYTGKDTLRQDYKKALHYWALAAKQDNADAIGNMAMCYQLGNGTQKDSTMAVNLYKAALKKGNRDIIAQHESIVKNTGSLFSSRLLKECYKDGIGTPKDIKKYVYYTEKAAEKKDVSSQYELALFYLNNQMADKAVIWFKEAAKQGKVGAIYYYGYLMFNGQGIVQDKKGGIKLLQSAADKDFTMAHYQLGRIYYYGDGTEQDYGKAVGLLRKAAERKNHDAKWLLGLCYLNGNGVDQDYYFATQFIADAAPSHQKELKQLLSDDNDGPYTQYLYGLKNYYIVKDYEAAISYFKKVDKAKNMAGKTMLAVCYGNKDYTKRNVKKAYKTLNKVSGYPIADYYLSSMLENGTGTKTDEKRALALLTNAAENGVAYAMCKLGNKYMEGDGVTRDLSHAAQLYLQAEALGHLTPESAKKLAECYVKKIGILPDLVDAEKRIEQLNHYKQNDSFLTMLRTIK
ncbi:MAG: SEL1-like repeat protein [Prevotellaceae bacterium]|nr:SEL1-like repeat protein [Candidatus Faecinaster equi]